MLVVTTNTVQDREILEYKGMVRGIVVRTPTVWQVIARGFKGLLSANNIRYVRMCEQARDEAYTMMIQHAVEVGANAVIGVRYDTGDLGGYHGSSEVFCYGTAVILR
jgi:uncharacterized protein YbjQ (UPF0145 family)